MNKTEIRKIAKQLRDDIYGNQKVKLDSSIYQKIIDSNLYKESKNIFTYISFGSEVDTKTLILKMLNDNKNIFVPKINIKDNSMEAIKITSLNQLEENCFGTLEPNTGYRVDPKEIDLIVTPGVAFDISGNRVGLGKGFYDRYFVRTSENVNKLGLAYECQVFDKIEVDKFDIQLDYLVTEKRFINTKK